MNLIEPGRQKNTFKSRQQGKHAKLLKDSKRRTLKLNLRYRTGRGGEGGGEGEQKFILPHFFPVCFNIPTGIFSPSWKFRWVSPKKIKPASAKALPTSPPPKKKKA